jgi:hypothetical protein
MVPLMNSLKLISSYINLYIELYQYPSTIVGVITASSIKGRQSSLSVHPSIHWNAAAIGVAAAHSLNRLLVGSIFVYMNDDFLWF